MKKLSHPIGEIKDHYQIVIVGSGYGGAIAASRLSRAGQEVCVLERGREFGIGDFPANYSEIKKNIRTTPLTKRKGKGTALYDFRINDDVNVFTGCGLGGTSLINRNVMVSPGSKVFEDPLWPEEIRNDYDNLISIDAGRAEEMLKPSIYPDSFPALTKLDALKTTAEKLDGEFGKIPISVNFNEGVNHVGVYQQACKLCGNCVSGCNYGAQNTLSNNYLPDAISHGAKIFTRVKVEKIAKYQDQWLVYYSLVDYGMEKFSTSKMFLKADLLILSAGTLGSAEILFRSRLEEGLTLSDCLGNKLTGNINYSGFIYNSNSRINILGRKKKETNSSAPIGPSITGNIHFKNNGTEKSNANIQDDSIPGGLVTRSLALGLAMNKQRNGKKLQNTNGKWLSKLWRKIVSVIFSPYHGATKYTNSYSSSISNTSTGKINYSDDVISVKWPDLTNGTNSQFLDDKLTEASKVFGGTYVKRPLRSKWYLPQPLMYAPLGGCAMSKDATEGVVNHKCQLFKSTSGNEVYKNFYVVDGSVIPLNPGIEPMLTISAVAERTCRLIAEDYGWKINYDLAKSPEDPRRDAKFGFEFSHSNRGFFSLEVRDKSPRFEDMKRFFLGEKLGKANQSNFDFNLIVDNDDVDLFVSTPAHQAKLLGTVSAKALSEHPLIVTEGSFHLLVQDPERVRGRYLYYRFKLVSREGKYYYFDGFRAIRKENSYDGLWANMSIMYFTLHEGTSYEDPIIGTGLLRLTLKDFVTKQFGTLTAKNITSKKDGYKVKIRFVLYFLRNMLKVFRWKIIFPGSNKRRAKALGF